MDEKQIAEVMRTFKKGKLRSSDGKTVTDPKQARAIAMSEGTAAEKRGKEKRTWKGRTRTRPRKS
jgi:hypothetical protein